MMQNLRLRKIQRKMQYPYPKELPSEGVTAVLVSTYPLAHRPNFFRSTFAPRFIRRFSHSCGLLPRFSGICVRRLVGGESGRLTGANVGILPASFVDLLTLLGADGIVMLLTLRSGH